MRISGRIPHHIGIIMDGNGRWAELRGLPRIEGHRRGVERSKEIIECAAELGIRSLTLFAFSTENWQRPSEEVTMLMKLLEMYLRQELDRLMRNGIVFRAIGDRERLPNHIQAIVREVEEKTSANRGMVLVTALSYSGRSEIIRAIKKILTAGIAPDALNEEVFGTFLDTAGLEPPDLIIRTSGEKRISNFLLWQAAYAELYFTDTLWPDFSRDELLLAIQDYQQRERRFGTVTTRLDAR